MLRKHKAWIVYSILTSREVSYEQTSCAINRKYCDDINIFEYDKILKLNIFLQKLSNKKIFNINDCNITLNSDEKDIFLRIIGLFNNNDKVALIPVQIIDDYKTGKISKETYLSFFKSGSKYAV